MNVEFLGSSTFSGSGKKMETLSKGTVYRWHVNGELWEVNVWNDTSAIHGDEDEAPVLLRVSGIPTEGFGDLEEVFRKYPALRVS